MALSAQRIEELRAKYNITPMGSTPAPTAGASVAPTDPEELIRQLDAGTYGAPAPDTNTPEAPKPFDMLDNPVTRGIQDVFPGKKIGEALGNAGGYLATAAHDALTGRHDLPNYDVAHGPGSADNAVATAADGANAAITLGAAGAEMPAALIPKVAASAGTGAALGGTKAIAEGKPGGDVLKDTMTGGAAGAAIPLAGEAVKGLGSLLGKAGDKIQFSVIKPTQADIKDGFKIETLKKYNLGGSLKHTFSAVETRMDDLQRELNGKIEAGTPLDLSKVYQDTAAELTGADKVKSFGSNSGIGNALEQLKGEVDTVTDPAGHLPLKDAQLVKRAASHMGAWQFGSRDPESTAREKVYNAFYTKLKDAIEREAPPGVGAINKQMGELIPVMNAVIRRIPIAERNNAISLSDIIALTGATLDPRGASVFLLNLASKSGAFGNMLSKAGGAISRGLPAAGNAARAAIPTALPGSPSQPQ